MDTLLDAADEVEEVPLVESFVVPVMIGDMFQMTDLRGGEMTRHRERSPRWATS